MTETPWAAQDAPADKALDNVRAFQSSLSPFPWGARDPWIAPAYGRRFDEDIPDSRLVLYDDLGHVPMEEDLVRTAAEVRRFLGAR